MDKNTTGNFRQLVESIYTREQLESVKDDIRAISGLVYKSSLGPFSNQIKNKVGPNIYFYIYNLEKTGRLPKTASLGNFLIDLSKFLDGIEKITLTLAFVPTAGFQREIAVWLSENLGKKVVADFVVNSEIIGGLIIEYNGKYKDYSKAAEIEPRKAAL